MRLTVAQALVRFLANQYSERDGSEQRLVAGCFGIFGHGNVAGIGQALLQYPEAMPYHQGRNEQGMVHAAAGYARMRNRLSTLACTTSVGPGSTNMLTGAALATINRLPVLLLPGDVFATRAAGTVLQELEDPTSYDLSVNDCFKPVSRYWDRIQRPEQLAPALLAALRVLTDPAETGAVTLALPQDVQAEAWEWPEELFERRIWRVRRPVPEREALAGAVATLRSARRPLIVAGGGTIYAEATEALRELVEATGIPVAETQAGKGSLPYDHPCSVGAIGATGTTAANALAREADVVLGVGTRWSDFTTASRSLFGDQTAFVNLNVATVDAFKHAGLPLIADAREGLEALAEALQGFSVEDDYRERARALAAEWEEVVERAYTLGHGPPPAQSEVIGVVNRISGPRDVVVCAAGSMPGDLHKLWRARDPKGYHVEYGFSCMGYEIAGGLGVKMADPDREVFVMVGDGSYLMMAQELVTAVQEGIKLNVVLVQNHGFASIGALSESLGSQRFGTRYRYRNPDTGVLDGDLLPVDLAANAASLGADVRHATTIEELEAALRDARASSRTTVVHVETDPLVPAPSSDAWWDVPVSEVAELDSTRAARSEYEQHKRTQRTYVSTRKRVDPQWARQRSRTSIPTPTPRRCEVIARIGIIGAGVMGAAHLRTIAGEVAGAHVVAVSDADLARARAAVAGGTGIRVLPDAYELIRSVEVDAVIIASSDATHEAFALACLAAGKPVLCEKPLATTGEASLRVVEAEVALGRRLVQVGFMRRFDAAYATVKRELDDGNVGPPLLVHCAHRNARVPPDYTSEMLITSSAAHEIDVARWLIGDEVVSVSVHTPRPTSRAANGMQDPQFVILEMQGGVLVDVEVFVNAGYGYDIRCELVGEAGTVALPPTVASSFLERFTSAYRLELQDWVRGLRNGAASGPSAWDGYAASVVADACLESLASGRPAGVHLAPRPGLYS